MDKYPQIQQVTSLVPNCIPIAFVEPLMYHRCFFLCVFATKVLAYIYFTRIVLVLFSAMLPFEVRSLQEMPCPAERGVYFLAVACC